MQEEIGKLHSTLLRIEHMPDPNTSPAAPMAGYDDPLGEIF
ncbi:hypothetical protein ALQ72_100890 [Pseudomonas syringae pv. maculicola]|nr:Unknown protein sequence [Pseudomonas syringae pv. maculicola]KPC56330.1 Unknown protein sequence [Pseudomonas amygdali pv. morsprunorum]RMM84440.1 hypothetical protein ALQ72_100890 [Pseudomonas syringae pv. maculicola]